MALNDLIDDLQKKLRRREQKIEELEEKLAALGGAGTGAGKETSTAASTSELAELRATVKDQESKIQALEGQLADQETAQASALPDTPISDLVQDLQKKIKRKDKENAQLEAEIQRLKGEVENWKDAVPSSEGGATPQPVESPDADQLATLQTQVSALQKQVQEKDTKIASLENQLSHAIQNADLQQDEHEQLQMKEKTIQRLKHTKEQLEARVREYETQATSLSEQVGTLSAQVEQVQGELANSSKAASELALAKEKLANLENQIAQKDQIIEGLRLTIKQQAEEEEAEATSTQSSALLEKKLSDARIQIQKLNDLVSEKNKEIMRLEEFRGRGSIQRLTEFEGELEQEREKHQKLYARINELEREQQESGTRQQLLRIREIQNLYESLKREVRLQQSQISDLRSQGQGF